jgi:hypothetical protein
MATKEATKEAKPKEVPKGVLKVTPWLFDVPPGHRMVFRNRWLSSSDNRPGKRSEEAGRRPEEVVEDPKGYTVDGEGFSFWVPKILHQPLGPIDLRPINRDPGKLKVQAMDGQDLNINGRFVERVMKGYGSEELGNECFPRDRQPSDNGNAIVIPAGALNNTLRFAILVESEGATDRLPLVNQVVTAALNSATANYPAISYTIDDLEVIAEIAFDKERNQQEGKRKPQLKTRIKRLPGQLVGWGFWPIGGGEVEFEDGKPRPKKGLGEFDTKELRALGDQILETANKELMTYGFKIDQLDVQSIELPPALQTALRRRAASIVEMHSAQAERSYIQELLKLLPEGEQNTWAALALIALQQTLDKVAPLVTAFLGWGEKAGKSTAGKPKE